MARFAVIGLGIFGSTLAKSLSKAGAEVIAIDIDKKKVEDVMDYVVSAVTLDARDPSALKSQGVDNVDVAIVSIGESGFEANELVTVAIKELGVKKIISKAANPVQRKILSAIGADEVICPEDESALRLSQKLLYPNIEDWLDISEDQTLIQIKAPHHFVGRDLRDIELRKKYSATIIGIKKRIKEEENGTMKYKVISLPGGDYVIQKDDILMVIGSPESMKKISRE